MKKILKLIFFVFVITMQGQEFSVYMSGGKSGFKYSEMDNSKLKLGGDFGLGYAHHLNKNWEILSGVEMGFYNNKWSLNNSKESRYLVDRRNSIFEYRVGVKSLEENSSAISVNIPLMLRYKMNIGIPMYVNLGGKVFLPIKQNVNITANNVQLSGYYPNRNLLYDDLPKHGFGKITELNSESSPNVQTAFSLSSELGTIIEINQKSRLYVGCYIDYGLTEIRKATGIKEGRFLFDYSSKGLDKVNLNDNLKVLNSSAKVVAYGVQLRYAFTLKDKVKEDVLVQKDVKQKEEPKQIKKELVAKKIVPKKVREEKIEKTVIQPKKKEIVVEKIVTKKLQEEKKEIVVDLKPKIFDRGTFEYKEININQELQVILDKAISDFNQNKYNSILIETHTDCRGSNKYNLNLSKQRAKHIYKYFIRNGIPSKKIEYKYYGEAKVINRCKDSVKCSEEEHKANRRIIITLR